MSFFTRKRIFLLLTLGIIIVFLVIYIAPWKQNSDVEGVGTVDSKRVAVLCYHHLAPEEEGLHENNDSVIPVEQFQNQMKYLYDEGYYTVTIKEIYDFIQGEIELPEKTVLITFDDGYESNYTYAYPILKEYELKATIFLIGKGIIDYENGLQGVIPKVSKEQIDEMVKSGLVSFENHTFDLHKYIEDKPASLVKDVSELEEDFQKYGDFVEQYNLPKPLAIAYPYGHSNRKLINTAERFGYKLGFTIKNGYIKKGDKAMTLSRFIIYPYYSLNTFSDIVKGKGIKINPEIKSPTGKYEYDLIVIGSDPEGITSAVSGSRSGLKTLLIDERKEVGGLMTLGGLATIDMNYDNNGKMVTKGLFEEFFNRVDRRTSIDVEKTIKVFDEMLKDYGVHTLLGRENIKPVIKGDEITGIRCDFDGEQEEYKGRVIIDATQDGDIAALAGVPHSIGMEDIGIHNRHMAVTPVFKLKGVNWEKVMDYLNNDDDPGTGADKYSAWGYNIMYEYKPKNPMMRMRGLNVAHQDDGSVLVNALQVFNVNPLDEESKERAITDAEVELHYIIDFMRENCPGFENAKFAGISKELYIRESRHIYGEYRLNIDDVLENRFFRDTIAFGSYPVDIQATSPSDYGMVMGNPNKYGIPLRSLVPLKIENLLVVGKSASFDSLAAGSARTIPVGMCTGEAAGITAWYVLANELSLREIVNDYVHSISIREMLNKKGASIYEFEYENPLEDHWCYTTLKKLRSKGFIFGRYDNNYFLDEKLTNRSTYDILNRIFMRINDDDFIVECKWEGHTTKRDVLEILKMFIGEDYNFKEMKEEGIISENTHKILKEAETLTGAHLYTLFSDIYDYYLN